MASYTNEQYADMIFFLGRANNNASQAVTLFSAKYPQFHPDHKTISAAWERLKHTGSVLPRKSPGAKRTATDDDHAVAVLQHVVQDPHTSTTRIALAEGVSQASVCRVLKRYKFHPYKVELHQELLQTDHVKRLEFSLWMEAMAEVDRDFVRRILWSDEAHFYRSGTVNRHNCRYWSDQNPHWVVASNFQVKTTVYRNFLLSHSVLNVMLQRHVSVSSNNLSAINSPKFCRNRSIGD